MSTVTAVTSPAGRVIRLDDPSRSYVKFDPASNRRDHKGPLKVVSETGGLWGGMVFEHGEHDCRHISETAKVLRRIFGVDIPLTYDVHGDTSSSRSDGDHKDYIRFCAGKESHFSIGADESPAEFQALYSAAALWRDLNSAMTSLYGHFGIARIIPAAVRAQNVEHDNVDFDDIQDMTSHWNIPAEHLNFYFGDDRPSDAVTVADAFAVILAELDYLGDGTAPYCMFANGSQIQLSGIHDGSDPEDSSDFMYPAGRTAPPAFDLAAGQYIFSYGEQVLRANAFRADGTMLGFAELTWTV